MPAIRTALVVGGGVAGPVTAAALVKAGIQATVYEAYPTASGGIGSALALAPNGMAALGVIGVDDAVRRIALPITASSMSVRQKNLGTLPALRGLPPLQMVDRRDLHRVLEQHARRAGVSIEYGKRLVDVDETRAGVTARFADGTHATGDVLIGADGVRSLVRTLIDPQAPAAGYTGLLGFGAVVEADLTSACGGGPEALTPGTMTFAFGSRAYYLYWPLPDGRIAWGANLPSKQYLTSSQAAARPPEEWVRVLRSLYAGDRPGEALAAATTPDNLEVLGAIHIMPPVPHWHRGRMVLVGDAVHAPSNSTGQGASLAIESGVELARCLRDLPDHESAFAAYEQLRRRRVEKIAARGAKINHAKAPGPVAGKLMRLVMPAMFRLMDPEKSLGPEQRHEIDWSATVQPVPSMA